MGNIKDSQRNTKRVSSGGLRDLLKNGRDYSKPTLSERLKAARESLGKKKSSIWMKIVSVPMGGMKK